MVQNMEPTFIIRIQVIIQQSKLFRTREPSRQAEFFKLLATFFYYMVSGNSGIGCLANDEWNQYYTERQSSDITISE